MARSCQFQLFREHLGFREYVNGEIENDFIICILLTESESKPLDEFILSHSYLNAVTTVDVVPFNYCDINARTVQMSKRMATTKPQLLCVDSR